MAAYRTSRRIEFRDTDAGGIAHFTAFFQFMEAAEHELLRSLGLSVHQAVQDGHISWPRVSVSCDFQQPVRFEDVLDIEVSIGRIGNKSVTYSFAFTHDGQHTAQGEITAVCCRLRPGQPPESIQIPAEIVTKLRTV